MRLSRSFAVGVLALLCATAALASWYEDYDAGIAAARVGNWNVVVQKMTAAIKGNPKENDKAREYGTIFINYHPYYYRGAAYLNLGKYEQAVSDLEQTGGPGEENLGSIETLMGRAKSKLAAASTPEPQPPPPVPVTPHPTAAAHPRSGPPTCRAVDRSGVAGPGAGRHQRRQQRPRRRAWSQGRLVTTVPAGHPGAGRRELPPRHGEEQRRPERRPRLGPQRQALRRRGHGSHRPHPPVPAIPQTRPNAAANAVLADSSKRVRAALEKYFEGEFEDSTRQFQQLTTEMPKNAWLWAFLGASQYSQYAFEADDNYKSAALGSFRKAKNLRRWDGGLPQKYFSKRIRKVFDATG